MFEEHVWMKILKSLRYFWKLYTVIFIQSHHLNKQKNTLYAIHSFKYNKSTCNLNRSLLFKKKKTNEKPKQNILKILEMLALYFKLICDEKIFSWVLDGYLHEKRHQLNKCLFFGIGCEFWHSLNNFVHYVP